jgi:hypothetical protein
MTTIEKLRFATREWFELVGRELCAAATQAALPADLNVSLLERYYNGEPIGPGVVPGFRLEISGGRPSFRYGAGVDEVADIVVDATVETIDVLARLRSTDPAYGEAISRFMAEGALKVAGDPSRLGAWVSDVHDIVCERTA